MTLARVAAVVCAAAALSSVWAQAVAAPPAAAQQCNACHGANGMSVAPDAPNLAGQPAIYLNAQLKAYRGGKRSHEVMNVVAKPLSDADIDALAAWYSSIKIEVKTP
jgi:cytochrome c553